MKRYSYKWNINKKIPLLTENPLGSFVRLKDAEKEINYWRQKYEEIAFLERRIFL